MKKNTDNIEKLTVIDWVIIAHEIAKNPSFLNSKFWKNITGLSKIIDLIYQQENANELLAEFLTLSDLNIDDYLKDWYRYNDCDIVEDMKQLTENCTSELAKQLLESVLEKLK